MLTIITGANAISASSQAPHVSSGPSQTLGYKPKKVHFRLDESRPKAATTISFKTFPKISTPQQGINSGTCVFYALANAFLATQFVPYDYEARMTRITQLVTRWQLFSGQKDDGSGINLNNAYRLIILRGREKGDPDVQELERAVMNNSIIYMKESQLNDSLTNESRQKLDHLKYKIKCAILLEVNDREGVPAHLLCLDIDKRRSRGPQIIVRDSLDVAIHDNLSSKMKSEEHRWNNHSQQRYNRLVTWLKNYLSQDPKDSSSKLNKERFLRVALYRQQIDAYRKKVQELEQLIKNEHSFFIRGKGSL